MTVAKPRILMVGQGHPALVAGGPEIAAYDLFRDLNQSGQAEASFLGCIADPHGPDPGRGALRPFDGAGDEYLLQVGDFDSFMLAHDIDSRALDDFSRLLEDIQPDIVHFHHLSLIGSESLALVRNRLPRARIVFTLHDFHPICHRDGLMTRTRTDTLCDRAAAEACHACFADISPGRFSLRHRHLQNMLGLVDRFIAPSLFLRERYDAWGISEHMIEWIPNAVPNDIRPRPAECRPRRNRFGYFGNVVRHKGPLLALDALRRIDPGLDLTLALHGAFPVHSDEFCGAFDRALEREGDRARYAGPYSRRDVARHMTAVDWVVVPSVWWENAPLTILESFRVGRPVIAADVGGMAELVDHGVDGLLFRYNDPADLARTMEMAASEEGLWDRLVSALPAVPAMAGVTARHMALYGELVMQPQKRSA